MIESGSLGLGDRLPAERQLAVEIGVSRPTVRTGLRALAAMGVVQSRERAGTYILSGPPTLGSEALSFMAVLQGFTTEEMCEAQRILEVGAAGLAAERATPEQVASMADEITGLFASLDNPQGFLVHDITFHRAVAAGSGNPIVASLVEMLSVLCYERRRETVAFATDRNLRDTAELLQCVYRAIRAHDARNASRTMSQHPIHSSANQAQEVAGEHKPKPTATPMDVEPDWPSRPGR
jgi:GntR family transcriptional repressor for pyruvate dehydrogenase complex